MCSAGVVHVCDMLLGKLAAAVWLVSAEVLIGSVHLGRDKCQAIFSSYHLQSAYLPSLSTSLILSFLSLLLLITQVSWFGLGGQLRKSEENLR